MESPKVKRWAVYNTKNFPDVVVDMVGVIENNQQFDLFLQDWLDLYKRKQKFKLYFDTSKVGWVSVKYAWKMVNFIKKLKRENEIEYLESSIIVLNSYYIYKIISIIFWLQKPVAPVVIANEKSVLVDRIYDTGTSELEKIVLNIDKENATLNDPLLQPETEKKLVRVL